MPPTARTFTLDETGLALLAGALALKLAPGDMIALRGDLGAGKTTFARAFIRSALADRGAEVPSPTFALQQTYTGRRYDLAHYDLYRLAGPDDLAELGFDEHFATAVTLVEWPERAGDGLPAARLDLTLAPGPAPHLRSVTLRAAGPLAARIARACDIFAFVGALADWREAFLVHLQGDASSRSYARLAGDTRSAVLMDSPRQPDGPAVHAGKPYSRIAHLAEDVRPFVAVDLALTDAGFAAPALFAHDLERGLLLLEDLGDLSFGTALTQGLPQAPMVAAAVDVLIALRRNPLPAQLPLPDGTRHTLPRFDRAALEIETELLLDWYWPAVKGAAVADALRREFRALWSAHIDRMLSEPPGLFLRDFHSPNLFWRPEQSGLARVGLIDFQDALAEPWAYDLVSLLQDARVDVPPALEQAERTRYLDAMTASSATFDRSAFLETYARFGAQRNTRLVGLWVRLLKRDSKPNYLRHMPRTWDYLARNLAHPALADLQAWYDRHLPEDVRKRPIPA
jgi:hypothetical protein